MREAENMTTNHFQSLNVDSWRWLFLCCGTEVSLTWLSSMVDLLGVRAPLLGQMVVANPQSLRWTLPRSRARLLGDNWTCAREKGGTMRNQRERQGQANVNIHGFPVNIFLVSEDIDIDTDIDTDIDIDIGIDIDIDKSWKIRRSQNWPTWNPRSNKLLIPTICSAVDGGSIFHDISYFSCWVVGRSRFQRQVFAAKIKQMCKWSVKELVCFGKEPEHTPGPNFVLDGDDRSRPIYLYIKIECYMIIF